MKMPYLNQNPAPTVTLMNKNISMLHLWRSISPAFPIGAYAYSQGLESATENQWIHDEESAQLWIRGLLQYSVGRLDIPVLLRLARAWQNKDKTQLQYWNNFLLASRESSELLAEDQHLGKALNRLLRDSEVPLLEILDFEHHPSFALMYSLFATHWQIPETDAVYGYLWTWCENQVAAAIKLIPLGQTAGQRILSQLINEIPLVVEFAQTLADDDIGATLPGLGICSAMHETQYSRLFRS